MPNVGPLEIAIVLVIVLVIFGPKRLPELGRSMGRGIHELRGSLSASEDVEREQDGGDLQKQGSGAETAATRRTA